MEDQKIFKMAFIVTLMGLIGMIIFADDISPQEVKIRDINPGMIDREVTVECFVEKVDKAKNSDTYFLRVNDGTGKTTVVLFEGLVHEIEKNGLSLKIAQDRRIRVTGKVTEYRGSMELVLENQNSLKLL